MTRGSWFASLFWDESDVSGSPIAVRLSSVLSVQPENNATTANSTMAWKLLLTARMRIGSIAIFWRTQFVISILSFRETPLNNARSAVDSRLLSI